MSIGYFWDDDYKKELEKEEKKPYSCHTCKYYGQSTSRYCRVCVANDFSDYEPGLNSEPVPEKREIRITNEESKLFWAYVDKVAKKHDIEKGKSGTEFEKLCKKIKKKYEKKDA
jgi:hypothetical protein